MKQLVESNVVDHVFAPGGGILDGHSMSFCYVHRGIEGSRLLAPSLAKTRVSQQVPTWPQDGVDLCNKYWRLTGRPYPWRIELAGCGGSTRLMNRGVVCNLASRKTDLQGNLGSHVIRFGRKETRVRSTSTGSLLEEMCMPSSNRKPWCQFRLHMCLQKCQSPLKRHWTYLKPHGPIGDWNSMVPLAGWGPHPRSLELPQIPGAVLPGN